MRTNMFKLFLKLIELTPGPPCDSYRDHSSLMKPTRVVNILLSFSLHESVSMVTCETLIFGRQWLGEGFDKLYAEI